MKENFWILLPLMWLGVTTVLGLTSGWFGLMLAYPNNEETPLFQMKWLSGSMGLGVSLQRILKISVCPSGLRFGISKFFGPFQRDFLVPWDHLSVTRKKHFFMGETATIYFKSKGSINLPGYVVNKLGRAVPEKWTLFDRDLPLQKENNKDILRSILKEWAKRTGVFGLLFILFIKVASTANNENSTDVWFAVSGPAFIFSIVAFFEYLSRREAR